MVNINYTDNNKEYHEQYKRYYTFILEKIDIDQYIPKMETERDNTNSDKYDFIITRLDGSKRKSIKRKSIKRKSIKRKSIKRKSIKRKSIKRKSIKRKSIKRKSIKHFRTSF